MRVPDRSYGPSFGCSLFKILVGIGCIDGGGFARNRIISEIAIIITQAGELMYGQHEPISRVE